MKKDTEPVPPPPDLDPLSQVMVTIGQRSQRIVSDFLARQAADPRISAGFDPLHIGDAFLQMTAQLLASPVSLVEAQMSLWSDYMRLWQNAAQQLIGGRTAGPAPAAAAPTAAGAAPATAWQQDAVFDFIRQSYLLTARWIQSLVKSAEGLDDATLHKVDFYTRQFIDAMNPTELFNANPELLRATIDSKGEALINGLDHLLADLDHSKSQLSLPPRTLHAFIPGEHVAVTPGQVVFRNSLFELLHYAPAAGGQRRTPLLIVPSWTHKYYLLDLRPSNSLVRWALRQGYSLFMLSWSGSDVDALAYVEDGLLAALGAIRRLTGETEVNGVGVGVGGTLLAMTQALLASRGQIPFISATYLASLLDFAQVGELSVFINEEQLRLEPENGTATPQQTALLSLLRANDLIWSFVLDTYKLGRAALPLDLLAWNADAPRQPVKLQQFYLSQLYQQNRLVKPGGITLSGVGLDLGRIRTPSYVLALADDHLAPWRSVFAANRLLGGPVRFVRADGGQAAGIVAPPELQRHGYWTPGRSGRDADRWLAAAHRQEGSWWEDWGRWLARQSGGRSALCGPLAPDAAEQAPGVNVRRRS